MKIGNVGSGLYERASVKATSPGPFTRNRYSGVQYRHAADAESSTTPAPLRRGQGRRPAGPLGEERGLRDGDAERGIIVCGSGAGVSIAANKFPGIRAAVCHDTYTAHQAVEHDDLNVLCVGARVIGPSLAFEIVETFVRASFSGVDRHQRRLAKILAIERRFSLQAQS